MKTDCAGYQDTPNGVGCSMLVSMLCRHGDCPFYKTPEQAEADRGASYIHRYKRGGPFTGFDDRYCLEDLQD